MKTEKIKLNTIGHMIESAVIAKHQSIENDMYLITPSKQGLGPWLEMRSAEEISKDRLSVKNVVRRRSYMVTMTIMQGPLKFVGCAQRVTMGGTQNTDQD